jgi:hypothetical protein
MLGMMLVAWREYRDTALRSERDVWAFTKLPTLAVISFTGDFEELKPRKGLFGRSKPELPGSTQPLSNTGR